MCVHTAILLSLPVTWGSPFLETAPFPAQLLGLMLLAGAVLWHHRGVMIPVTDPVVLVLSKSCARKGEGCYGQQEGPGHKNIYRQYLCAKHVTINCFYIFISHHGVVDVHAEDAASEQGLVDGAQGSEGSGPALTLCLLSCCSAAPLQSSLLPLAFLLCACDSSRS